jgi:phospholipase/carboxylesterase
MRNVPLRLAVRSSKHPALAGSAEPGVHRIAPGPHGHREALVRVPPRQAEAGQPIPLALMLHGSGGEPAHALDYLEPFASDAGVLLVAPASRDYTWDAILGRRGPDIEAVNHALHWAFDRFLIDPERISVAGFSDGASYALALGLANGDVFGATVALSPGFIPGVQPVVGGSRVFVSHGTGDTVLPIDRCSRRIVQVLREEDYDVTYEEFEGGHVIPPRIAERACRWMLDG